MQGCHANAWGACKTYKVYRVSINVWSEYWTYLINTLNTEFVSFLSCLLFLFVLGCLRLKFCLSFRPYRPMFGTPGKVPGSASLLRASETGRLNSARTQSRSTTPGILRALSLEMSSLFLRPKFYLVSRHVVSKIKLNKCFFSTFVTRPLCLVESHKLDAA